jgi:hypothetical protein
VAVVAVVAVVVLVVVVAVVVVPRVVLCCERAWDENAIVCRKTKSILPVEILFHRAEGA